jgi:hypothetical protein
LSYSTIDKRIEKLDIEIALLKLSYLIQSKISMSNTLLIEKNLTRMDEINAENK